MTASVPAGFQGIDAEQAYYTGKPYTAGLAAGFRDRCNHLLGRDMPSVHRMSFGSSEGGTGTFTYRFLYLAHPNVRALVFDFVPRGQVATVADHGEIAVPSAETTTPLIVAQDNADVADLGDIAGTRSFTRPVTAGAFAEITYTTTDVRLHFVDVWEVPRATLSGTQKHLDRSFAFPSRFIDDDNAASNRRGQPALLTCIDDARVYMRRHWTPFVNPAPTATNPGADNTWTDVTGWDNLRMRGRAVKGSATAGDMDVRAFIYASVSGGATFQFRMVGSVTSAASADITGVAAWRPGSAGMTSGLTWRIGTVVESTKIQVQRTAGVGAITINGLTVIENPV